MNVLVIQTIPTLPDFIRLRPLTLRDEVNTVMALGQLKDPVLALLKQLAALCGAVKSVVKAEQKVRQAMEDAADEAQQRQQQQQQAQQGQQGEDESAGEGEEGNPADGQGQGQPGQGQGQPGQGQGQGQGPNISPAMAKRIQDAVNGLKELEEELESQSRAVSKEVRDAFAKALHNALEAALREYASHASA